jgi:hypothetical protein
MDATNDREEIGPIISAPYIVRPVLMRSKACGTGDAFRCHQACWIADSFQSPGVP